MSELPEFRYHGAPIGAGMIEAGDQVCGCCGKSRGYVYSGTLYGENTHSIAEICPWCIADGSARSKLGVSFNHADHLPDGVELPASVADELFNRTPGFPSWQERTWLCHCGDACRFMGDLPIEEARHPDWDAVERLMSDYGVPDFEHSMWDNMISNYEPANPSVFKFVCCVCGLIFYQIDAP